MSAPGWSLSAEQRQETVRRTADNLLVLAHSRGRAISDKDARSLAAQLEGKAFTVATIESETTTGQRPGAETTKAYARKIAALLIESLASQDDGSQAVEDGGSETLNLAGGREFMTRAGAERALAPLFAVGSSVKRIKLSTKSFGLKPDDSAGVVARGLRAAAASLTDVDLSDVIAGRPEDEALAALRTMSEALATLKLRRLDLSDNALGEKGLRACSAAFAKQAHLEFLALQNVGCSINACAALREMLKESAELRGMHFYNNMSDNAGAASIAEILGRAPKMEDFKMGSSRVGAEGGSALARGLMAGQQLVRLDLSDNPMTGEVADSLAQLIRSQPHLRALNLNDTSLGEEGTAVIVRCLESSAPGLQELGLALNEITSDVAEELAGMLSRKSELRSLNLSENELGDEGTIAIASGLKQLKALQTVDMTGNQIHRASAVALASAVAGCSDLQLLALNENEISEAGIKAVEGILDKMGKLDALGSLEDNEPGSESDVESAEPSNGAADALAEALSRTKIQ